MTTTTQRSRATALVAPEQVFRRVLVGVDGSPESREAAWQAERLLEPDGELTLLAAFGVPPAVTGSTGFGVPAFLDVDVQRTAAEDALRQVAATIEGGAAPQTKLFRAPAWEALTREAERDEVTLIAVGSHGMGRGRGILVGSTATEVVHKARCSVLVARRVGPFFPHRIVVGVDGSPQSAAGYAVAQRLSTRFDAELWPVVARGGKGVDERLVATIVGHRYEGLPDKPVSALVAAAADADLVVVGSRGLHGLASLGSVSERVAHQASSSVLIVRDGDDD